MRFVKNEARKWLSLLWGVAHTARESTVRRITENEAARCHNSRRGIEQFQSLASSLPPERVLEVYG
jgi:hypothetical protein